MRKCSLRSKAVSSQAYVEEAALFARALTWAEARCPGDYANAMKRAARRAGVTDGLLWRLHYRQPKQIDIADFEKLGVEVGRRKLRETGKITPRTALGRWLVETADKLDRIADEMGWP
jgi:hypothetical protein